MTQTISNSNSRVVLGVTLGAGSWWDRLANAPCQGLFAQYEDGHFIWTNESGISRDVQLLWRLAAGQPIATLWRCKCRRHVNNFKREELNHENPLRRIAAEQEQRVTGPDDFWLVSYDAAMELIVPKSRNGYVIKNVTVRPENHPVRGNHPENGYRVFLSYTIKSSDETGEDFIETEWEVSQLGDAWEQNYLKELRERVVTAVPSREWMLNRSAYLGTEPGLKTYRAIMTPFAFRCALYFNLIPTGKDNNGYAPDR